MAPVFNLPQDEPTCTSGLPAYVWTFTGAASNHQKNRSQRLNVTVRYTSQGLVPAALTGLVLDAGRTRHKQCIRQQSTSRPYNQASPNPDRSGACRQGQGIHRHIVDFITITEIKIDIFAVVIIDVASFY